MTERKQPEHIARLIAWNENFCHAVPSFQADLARALAEHGAMLEALKAVQKADHDGQIDLPYQWLADTIDAAIARAVEG